MVVKMVSKAKEECGRGPESKSRREPLKLKYFEDKGKKVNLFKNQYFNNSTELYKELMAMRDTANRFYKDFKNLVTTVARDSFGTLESIEVKIPQEEKDMHPQLLEVFQQIFKPELSKDKLLSIIKKVDESVQNELRGKHEVNQVAKEDLFFKIMEVWIKEVNDIVSKRKLNSVETKCELTDLLSSSIQFKSLDHLKKALESTADSCYALNY